MKYFRQRHIFLGFKYQVICSNIHTSVYHKRDDFGFPIVYFPWLSSGVPRLPSYRIYISELVRFAWCCTSVFDFHPKNHQVTSKLLTRVSDIASLGKRFGSSLGHTLNFCPHLVQYRFKNMYHKESLTQHSTVILSTNFISSGSKIVKRIRRRQYDPAIIYRNVGIALSPFTALFR